MTVDLPHDAATGGLAVAALWWVVWSVVAARRRRSADEAGEAAPRAWDLFAYEGLVVAAAAVGLILWWRADAPLPSLLLGGHGWVAVAAGAAVGAAWWLVLADSAQRRRVLGHRRPPTRPGLVHAGVYAVDAVAEEVIHRGLVLVGLAGLGLGMPCAIAASSLAFGAMHVFVLGPRGVPAHVVFGVLLGVTFVLGGLLAAMAAHTVYNTLVVADARAAGPARSPRPLPTDLPGGIRP